MADNNTYVFDSRGRGVDTTSAGLAANQCYLLTSMQTVYTVCQPTKFFLKMISADFDLTPFAGAGGVVPLYDSVGQRANDPARFLSGARTGITLEGPFLKYTIAKNALQGIDMRGTYNNGAIEFWFDLVSNRTIFLPWMGSLEIVCQYPGRWEFETFFMPDYGVRPDPRSSHPRLSQAPSSVPSPLDSDMTLSLRLSSSGAGQDTARVFEGVPPGIHSFTVNTESLATIAPRVDVWQENAPQRGVGFGGIPVRTATTLVQPAGVSAAFMNRLGWHNASAMKVWAGTGATDVDGQVQMHLGFT